MCDKLQIECIVIRKMIVRCADGEDDIIDIAEKDFKVTENHMGTIWVHQFWKTQDIRY